MAQSILVTGGAGYIGSHTVRMLTDVGQKIVVLDNMVYGHPEAVVSPEVMLVRGEMADEELVERLFQEHAPQAVVHFAAYCYVGESVQQPGKYYRNNTAAPLTVLDAMRRHGCDRFIFSSTCATYGNPEYVPMDEQHPQNPINPYGRSKLMLERILRDYEHAHGIRSVFLRYFNACGCSLDGVLGEDHDPETHLIPLALRAVSGERDKLTVFGTDYDTPDGTCIRDYIHVLDLADAHVKALEYLNGGGQTTACNLGTGDGTSVKEIIGLAEEVTGQPVPVECGPRRPGDPPRLVAAAQKAKDVLGWEAHYGARDAVETAWNWMSQPHGGRYGQTGPAAGPA
ncbi:MAG: UDP-glucose 4-epimerase GalE [Armatimonadetes bacterium CG_4_10_14_0_8_um_filter_66_14]|nr:MAG: UDP-glucose 4-epimerase GalE [Armatimonadetes bacterium CG_4_10_14_0_8_um_filter_66_14]